MFWQYFGRYLEVFWELFCGVFEGGGLAVLREVFGGIWGGFKR